MNAFGQTYSLRTCSAARAVERFLVSMRKVSDATFPAWRSVLKTALEDCALDYDARRAVLEIHPLDDYYFAAIVGKEAAQIRALFDAEEAMELLSELAERVDAAAGRKDRAVSALVFDIVSHVEITSVHPHRQPHDETVAIILRRLNIDTTSATRCLMDDLLFRHTLGEPLALEVPNWWIAFRKKFNLTKMQSEGAMPEIVVPRLEAPMPIPEIIKPRGARSII